MVRPKSAKCLACSSAATEPIMVLVGMQPQFRQVPPGIVEVDADDFRAHLGRMDRRRIAARPAADDHQVHIVPALIRLCHSLCTLHFDGFAAMIFVSCFRFLLQQHRAGVVCAAKRRTENPLLRVKRGSCRQCLGRDSNPHEVALGDFKSPVSAIPPPGVQPQNYTMRRNRSQTQIVRADGVRPMKADGVRADKRPVWITTVLRTEERLGKLLTITLRPIGLRLFLPIAARDFPPHDGVSGCGRRRQRLSDGIGSR